MQINYDDNKLKAALEVIMDKAVAANDEAKYDENNKEMFLEFLGKELYRLIRGLEKQLWCDSSAAEVAAAVDKIKSIKATDQYENLKQLISGVYEYGRPQDNLWPRIRDFVKDSESWIFTTWNAKKGAK